MSVKKIWENIFILNPCHQGFETQVTPFQICKY